MSLELMTGTPIPAFPRKVPQKGAGPLKVSDYASEKGFDEGWLRELGIKDDARGVRMPYRDEQGEVKALRWRLREDAPARFLWAPAAQLLPYGLWLPLNAQAGGLVLVEGESDAHTLWLLGLPALGIPGAACFRPAWAAHMRDRPVWLHVENDQGGQTFVARTAAMLREGGHRGPVYRFACADIHPNCKDVSDLYLQLGHEPALIALRRALAQRILVGETNSESGMRNVEWSEENSECGMRNSELGAEEANSESGIRNSELEVEDENAQAADEHVNGDGESGTQKAPLRPKAPLDAYAASALWGAVLPRPLMVLDNTLTAGLTLLAGAPKKGKSWLALALGMAVAEGQPLLGRPTRRGEVLYLDLESRQYRVQERLSALRKGPPPEGLYITHRAPRLDGGLLDALGAWVKAHPDTALIIVDTLARIKCPGQGGENAYEADTRILGAVQRFALDHGLCVLLVHHLRKSVGGVKEQDVYERVSGSTGLTGVCDCVLVLDGKRQETEAQLYVDGRDIPPAQLALGFDQGRWSLLSEDGAAYQSGTAYEQSPLPNALKKLMEGKDRWEGTASELVEVLYEVSNGAADVKAEVITLQLRTLQEQLMQRESIAIGRATVKGRRYIRITPANVTTPAPVQQSMQGCSLAPPEMPAPPAP